jgi:cholesterol transport system auxiliary component
MLKVVMPAVVGFMLFSGCSTKVPHVSEYKLSTPKKVERLSCNTSKKITLKVLDAYAKEQLMQSSMYYGVGKLHLYKYNESAWIVAPNRAITEKLILTLEGTNLFRSVVSEHSRARTDRVLEVEVEDFMHYFAEDEKSSFVHIAFRLTLIDKESSKIIASKSFEAKKDVLTQNAEGGVEALDALLDKELKESAEWLSKRCQ